MKEMKKIFCLLTISRIIDPDEFVLMGKRLQLRVNSEGIILK